MTETKPKFTTGPWSINLDNKTYSVYAKRPGYETRPWMLDHLFSVATMVEGDEREKIANLHLIAVAPEMYELLDRILGRLELCKLEQHIDIETEREIRELLAKARGDK